MTEQDVIALSRIPDWPGVVYFARRVDDGLIKIGFTQNLQQRVHGLRSTHQCSIEILGMVSGTLKTEKLMHQAFRRDRIFGGEWFRPSDDLLKVAAGEITELYRNLCRGCFGRSVSTRRARYCSPECKATYEARERRENELYGSPSYHGGQDWR